MKLTPTRFLGIGALLACLLVPAFGQDYPTKPIRFIVPIPAGGSSDVLARDVAQKLGERLGQPVVVENRPGGAGSLGAAVVAQAPADGYTLLLVNSGHAINPHVYKSLPFDSLKDFTAVSHMTDLPMGLFVHPSVPANTLPALLALLRAQPDRFSFASSGNGGGSHLAGQMFMQHTGTKLIHVPYRGSAPALNDVLGGQVPMMIADVPLAAAHVKTGALRALAVTSPQRLASMPDVPTFDELGIKGMDLSIWIGVLTTANSPPAVVRKLNENITAILKEPAMAERVRARGFTVVAGTPEQFNAQIRKDYERFGEVVRATGVKAD